MTSTGTTGDPLLDQAWEFFHAGDYSRAIPLLHQAAAGTVNPSLAEYRLGLCFRAIGQHDDAIEHFRLSATIEPKNAWAYFQVGKEFAMQGLLRAALPEFARAVDRDLTHADAYHDAAACLGSLGHFRESLACFTVCAFACEVVTAAGVYTSLKPQMLERAMNQLAGLIGDEEYHAIRARVWRAFGMLNYPQAEDHIPASGFEVMRAEVTEAMRKYGMDEQALRGLLGS